MLKMEAGKKFFYSLHFESFQFLLSYTVYLGWKNVIIKYLIILSCVTFQFYSLTLYYEVALVTIYLIHFFKRVNLWNALPHFKVLSITAVSACCYCFMFLLPKKESQNVLWCKIRVSLLSSEGSFGDTRRIIFPKKQPGSGLTCIFSQACARPVHAKYLSYS